MTKMKLLPPPSLERLKQALHYEPDTGNFYWTDNHPRIRWRGKKSGTPHHNGYIKISLDGQFYAAHRLAWLYVTGAWPKVYLDHINRDRADNRIANLRECDSQLNWFNSRARSASGLKGVYRRTANPNRWYAEIRVGGKLKTLGTFGSRDEAAAVYAAAARLHRGEFARLS
jgi:hypothetical protein